MAFADRLKYYRSINDMKQEELANKIGVSQKTISSWETGRSEPTMKEVTKLCRTLDCTVEDLTDTRARKVGEISIPDILVKIDVLGKEDLMNIESHIKSRIKLLIERENIQNEKDDLMRKMMILQKQMADLEHKKKRMEDGNR